MVSKIGFANWNEKMTLLHASVVVTYYIKLFRTGADRHNGILMSVLLIAETKYLKMLLGHTLLKGLSFVSID